MYHALSCFLWQYEGSWWVDNLTSMCNIFILVALIVCDSFRRQTSSRQILILNIASHRRHESDHHLTILENFQIINSLKGLIGHCKMLAARSVKPSLTPKTNCRHNSVDDTTVCWQHCWTCERPLYSYITMNSTSTLKFVHHYCD